MSVNAQFVTCDHTGLTDEQIIRELAVVHSDGRKGFRTAIVTVNECDDLSKDITCDNTNKSVMAIIRERLYLDGCGNLTLIFFNVANAS